MKRLVDELEPSARRDVLTSATSDVPQRPEARTRALAAALGALGPPPVAKSVRSSMAAVKIGALAVVVGGAALVLSRSPNRPVEPPPTVSVALPSAASPTEPTAEPPPAPSATPTSPSPAPRAAEAVPKKDTRATPIGSAKQDDAPAAPTSHAKPDDTLAREVRAVGAARNALTAGDATTALRELDAYDQIPNASALRPEARILRLEALARAGRANEARELGAALRRDPSMNGYARRIDAVLGP